MSYLAYTAAPYEEQNNNDPIEEKRQALSRNKTIKKRPSENVQKILQTISAFDPENDDNLLGDFNFNPPPKAELSKVKDNQNQNPTLNNSIGTDRTGAASMPGGAASMPGGAASMTGGGASMPGAASMTGGGANTPTPYRPSNMQESFANTFSNDYVQQYVPYYNQMSQGLGSGNKDQLLEKLNYMIHLLEDQQDQKTGHVMEEIILYSFLGIFLIFIVDSFARAGKYVR